MLSTIQFSAQRAAGTWMTKIADFPAPTSN